MLQNFDGGGNKFFDSLQGNLSKIHFQKWKRPQVWLGAKIVGKQNKLQYSGSPVLKLSVFTHLFLTSVVLLHKHSILILQVFSNLSNSVILYSIHRKLFDFTDIFFFSD